MVTQDFEMNMGRLHVGGEVCSSATWTMLLRATAVLPTKEWVQCTTAYYQLIMRSLLTSNFLVCTMRIYVFMVNVSRLGETLDLHTHTHRRKNTYPTVTFFWSLFSIFRFLSANRLEKIPHHTFLNVKPGQHIGYGSRFEEIMWVSCNKLVKL